MPSAKSSRNGRNEIRQVQTTGQWKSLSHPLIYHGRGKLLIFGYRHRWLWHFKGGGSKLPCMRKGTISISTTAPAECFASPEPLPILTGHAHHKGPEIADPERSVPWCRYSELAKNRGATIAATKPCSKLWHEVVARWLNLGEPLKHRGQEAVPHTCLYDLLLHSNILTYMYVGMSCGHKTQSKNKHDLRYQLYCIYTHFNIRYSTMPKMGCRSSPSDAVVLWCFPIHDTKLLTVPATPRTKLAPTSCVVVGCVSFNNLTHIRVIM